MMSEEISNDIPVENLGISYFIYNDIVGASRSVSEEQFW